MAGEAVSVAQAASSLNWLSIFGGAVVGSALSGFINIVLHQRNLNKAAEQRNEDRQEKRKALAFAFFVKLTRILSDGHTISRDLREELAKANGDETAHPALLVRPIAPTPEKVSFTADELGLVLSLDDTLFNDVAALDRLHASVTDLVSLYSVTREKLLARFGAKIECGSSVGTTFMTSEEREWFMPRLIEADGIVVALLEYADDCKQIGADTAKRWHALMVKEFKLKQTFDIEFGKAKPNTPAANTAA
ncbi:hypothetical protein [Bosea sp. WAO]|uniref:hypothetical protein n=1 Tax=Bosea sp. WAO TaxID=406341 RepID=UPI0012ED9294|nr:hypothetical protein [Bosea sp. WAO]